MNVANGDPKTVSRQRDWGTPSAVPSGSPAARTPNTSGTSYNYQAVAPTDKRLTQQISLRADYSVSNKLRIMGKYATQRATVKVTPGSIPGFTDTLQKYPFIKHGVITVDYTATNTMFFEGTYGGLQNWAGTGPTVTSQANRFNSGVGNIPFLFPDAQKVDPRYFTYNYLEAVKPPSWQNGQLLLMPTFLWGQRISNSGTRTATAAPQPPSLIFPSFLNVNRTQDVSISMTNAGFGAATGAQTMRSVQFQLRFQF